MELLVNLKETIVPAPCPFAIWIEAMQEGSFITFENYKDYKSAPHRRQRVNSLGKRLAAGDWVCRWCGDPIEVLRRADACYCRYSCQKRPQEKGGSYLIRKLDEELRRFLSI